MKYTRFEELPVWQAAMTLAERVFRLTADKRFQTHGDLHSQLQRATLSISNNVAEGFERGTTQELLTFLYIARGSSGEVRSMLCLLERLPSFHQLKTQVRALNCHGSDISSQLGSWAAALQNSEVKGLRYMSGKSRRIARMNKERDEFLEKLHRMQEERILGLQKSRQRKEETNDLSDPS